MPILDPFPIHSLVDSGLCIHDLCGIKRGSSYSSKANILITNVAILPSNDLQEESGWLEDALFLSSLGPVE
jgi:hypothetical protein